MKLSFFQKSSFSIKERLVSFVFISLFALWCTTANPFIVFEFAFQKNAFETRDDLAYFMESLQKYSYLSNYNTEQLSAPIRLITIDDSSLAALNLEWPIPRSVYADLIEKVEKSKPRVIGLDLIFPEASPHPENDRKLARCLKKYPNVILGSLREIDPTTDEMRIQYPASILIPGWTKEEKMARIGFVDSGQQESSGIIRKARLLIKEKGATVYSFDTLLLSHFLSIPLEAISDHSDRGFQQVGDIRIPVNMGTMWINYVKRDGDFSRNIYRSCSLSYVLDEKDTSKLKELFENNIVLVGVTAAQGFEVKESPLGSTTGPEIHINILSTILYQKFLQEPGPLAWFLSIIIPSILLATIIPFLSPGLGFALYLLTTYAVLKYSNYSFLHHGNLHHTASCLVLLFLTYTVMTIVYFAKIYRHRKHLKNLLLELAPVPEPVLEKIIGADQGQVRLGGEKVELTILFSDIRGYTSLSQNLDPREVMDTLNEFYGTTGTVHKKNGGMVFDTMGDGQMLVYGAEETSKKNHAFMACKAALEVREALSTLNDKWAGQGRNTVSIGIGINTGPVSLGFLGTRGSGHYKQYAAIGDTTNVASRIESLTKQLQAEIIISETTYEKAKELIEVEPLPPTRVKGKDEPLNIYKVTGIKVNK